MVNIDEILTKAVEMKASDIHMTINMPPIYRINGELVRMGENLLALDTLKTAAEHIMGESNKETIAQKGEVDFSYSIPGVARFRVNVYRQRKSYTIAARIINSKIPDFESLDLPAQVLSELAMKPRGLILVTGPTGSGKSTTLAAMVNYINKNKSCHILTLEDPIEYLFKHDKSMINQREIGDDTISFANGLRSALREDPDIVLVGEMRDLETIATAVTASETGHLVLSTLHTVGAVETINRIIDAFPPHQQQQIRVQLASVLQGVVSQQLLRRTDIPGRVVAMEIMLVTDAIRNNIREGKNHLIHNVIQTGYKIGMMPMDMSLANLVRNGKISIDEGMLRCTDPVLFKQYLNF